MVSNGLVDSFRHSFGRRIFSELQKIPISFRSYGGILNWLGTGNVTKRNREYLPFAEARAFVHALHLKNKDEWRVYCCSGRKPANIPAAPRKVYPSQFTSMDDWLGYFLPFEEARAFVHTLGLKSSNGWRAYCQSGRKPTNIPAAPADVYGYQFRGMDDWLGVVKRWNKAALLGFLEDLFPRLRQLEERELYVILQQARALPALRMVLSGASSLQVLEDLMNNHGQKLMQALGPTEDEDIVVDNEQEEEEDEEEDTADLDHLILLPSPVEGSQSLGRESLHLIDFLFQKGYVNDEVANYLVTNRISLLWECYISEGKEAVADLLAGCGGPFFTQIKERFLAEVAEVEGLTVPDDWSFTLDGCRVLPNAMQRRLALAVRNERRVGNWSGTGAGKTLAAILASRVCNAQVTLVITKCATVAHWRDQIIHTFPKSCVQTDPNARPLFPREDTSHYLVLNYERFQGPHRHALVESLLTLPIDLIVLDQVQLVKPRDGYVTQRRISLERLMAGASARNFDLRVLGISATSVINNLLEVRKLLELVAGQLFLELDTQPTVQNVLAMHRALMRYGIPLSPAL